MSKRFTGTELWEEDWFLEMPNEYKLFWYYILATCDHAGLFKVNLRSFRSLLEVELTPNKALEFFNKGKDRIRVISDSTWYIEDFFVYQYGTIFNWNNRVHESIGNLLIRHKIELTSIRGLVDLKDRVKDKDKDISKKGGVGENKNGHGARGKRIDLENAVVFFDDASYQKLGDDQLFLAKKGSLRPQDIFKGMIY